MLSSWSCLEGQLGLLDAHRNLGAKTVGLLISPTQLSGERSGLVPAVLPHQDTVETQPPSAQVASLASQITSQPFVLQKMKSGWKRCNHGLCSCVLQKGEPTSPRIGAGNWSVWEPILFTNSWELWLRKIDLNFSYSNSYISTLWMASVIATGKINSSLY